jgi:cytochrome c551
VIVLSSAALAVGLAACGDGNNGSAAGDTTTAATSAPAATTEATTTESATTTEGTTTEDSGRGNAVTAGKQVFADAGCGGCHVLQAAGASGDFGPNLDQLQPTKDQVVQQVTNGGGGMPAFGGDLTTRQIENVAEFVSKSANGG